MRQKSLTKITTKKYKERDGDIKLSIVNNYDETADSKILYCVPEKLRRNG